MAGEAERYAPVADPILWGPKLQIHPTITLTKLILQGNPFSPSSTQTFIYSFMKTSYYGASTVGIQQ